MNAPLESPPEVPKPLPVPKGVITLIVWFGALLVLCYAPILYAMGNEWMTDPDMGHGLFVPAVAAWVAWQRRDDLAKIEVCSSPWGLVLVALGAALAIAGTLGVEFFVARIGFIVSLTGVILYIGGAECLRVLAFPLFLLLFMIRIPAIIYNQITFPLQLFASRVAETSLWTLGIPVLREGNILELPTQRLSVVEACSGIRSLLSLAFLSLIYSYFFDEKVWMRWLLLVATVPIAVTANAFRVTMTGVLSGYNKEWTEGLFHSMEGWLIFVVALAILVITHQVFHRIWLITQKRRAAIA